MNNLVSGYWYAATIYYLVHSSQATATLVSTGMRHRISMSYSGDKICGDNMNFPMGLI